MRIQHRADVERSMLLENALPDNGYQYRRAQQLRKLNQPVMTQFATIIGTLQDRCKAEITRLNTSR